MMSFHRILFAIVPASSLALASGCSGSSPNSGNLGGGANNIGGSSGASVGGDNAAGGTSGLSQAGGAGAVGSGNGGTGVQGSCLAATFLNSLGQSSLMVGAAMEDTTANSAPFDGRYQYLSGGYFDGTDPCTSCATGCATNGTSCANASGGCGWWGCWQYDQDPPGQYVVSFVTTTGAATYNGQAHPQIPMFTYYQVLQASGVSEGTAEVTAMNNQAFLHKYFADFRLMLQKIGRAAALVHIEPDFLGLR